MSDNRNVVLVTVDSLRADHCGFLGHDGDTTPTLDKMADDGLVFRNAIAPGPSTYDSMPAVFTGRHMTPYTAGDEFDGDQLDRWTENIERNMRAVTIPEWFDEQGYATAAFTTNPYTGTHSPFARGFDRFEDFLEGGEGVLMQKAAHVPVLSELKHLVTLMRGDRASKPWTDYYDELIRWTREVQEPYFLWVFLLDTHTPYLVPDRFRSTTGRVGMYYHNWKLWFSKKWTDSLQLSLDPATLKSLYNDAIRSVDAFVGTLADDLEETDPALVVHADHGEAFGEHGIYGHKEQLYEENIRVPLLVSNGHREGTETTPISLKELPALLRRAASGGDTSEPDSNVEPEGPVLAKTWDSSRLALRGQNWKYIATLDTDTGDVRSEEVYDLSTDPDEQRNIADERGQLTDLCQRVLQRHLSHQKEIGALRKSTDEIRVQPATQGDAPLSVELGDTR